MRVMEMAAVTVAQSDLLKDDLTAEQSVYELAGEMASRWVVYWEFRSVVLSDL